MPHRPAHRISPHRRTFLAAALLGAAQGVLPAVAGAPFLRVDAPPVVQSSPAYCAPASLSRALALEGVRADQEELARLGGCSPEQGAALDALCDRLSPWLRARGLRIRALSEMSAEKALDRARSYNLLAEDEGFPPLPLPVAGSHGPVELERLFEGARLDPMRRLSAPDLAAFRARVRAVLAGGRPLLWGVVLGIADEPCAPASVSRGGHLRLIVGHDPDDGLVLYSDPWGPDCPVRTMPDADACAITMSLRVLEPVPATADADVDRILGTGRDAALEAQIDRILGAGRNAALEAEIDRILGAGRDAALEAEIDRILGED